MKNLILSVFIVVGLLSVNGFAKDKKDKKVIRKPAQINATCTVGEQSEAIRYNVNMNADWTTTITCTGTSRSNKDEVAVVEVKSRGYRDAVDVYELAENGKLRATMDYRQRRDSPSRAHSLHVVE